MILVNKETNVIVAIVNTVERVHNGIYVDKGLFDSNGNKKDMIYADVDNSIDIVELDAPSGVSPVTHCYSAEDGFYKNPDFKPVVSMEEQIEQLKSENTSLQLALVELASAAEQDKLETQLAIEELASLLVGGEA